MIKRVILPTLCILAVVTGSVAPGLAATKVGSEFRVNSRAAGNQIQPATDGFADGASIVVWSSSGNSNPDAPEYDVFAQYYNKKGNNTRGGSFRVNGYTNDNQTNPDVATLENGGFVVVWTSEGQDGSISSIYARRFDKNGNKVGKEFRVNTYNDEDQFSPRVAGLSNGGFVVVWGSWDQDGSQGGVYAQRYNKKGKPAGGEFRVNTTTQYSQLYPAIASLKNGGFVVVWSSTFASVNDPTKLFGQRFTGKGAKVGSQFPVSAKDHHARNPDVAVLTNGDFVVAWTYSGVGGGTYSVYAQRFYQKAKKKGGEFRLNAKNKGDQLAPRIAALPKAKFVGTWSEATNFAVPSTYDIKSGVFNKKGKRVGKEYTVNTFKNGRQNQSDVARLGDRGYLIVWKSEDQDTSGDGIYGQRYK
ncbi:hypothetical protein [Microbaculum marinum]|uniref:Uncharacterized protein n=1 Tax=Microbaculum marinum TaxID=1764581 RepID=A0AAW9RS56_9HYPH